MSSNNWSESKYLVLGWHIAENMKTHEDEIELTMFDLHKDPETDCIVTLTAPAWQLSRRNAQWHEAENAGKLISGEFPKFEKGT